MWATPAASNSTVRTTRVSSTARTPDRGTCGATCRSTLVSPFLRVTPPRSAAWPISAPCPFPNPAAFSSWAPDCSGWEWSSPAEGSCRGSATDLGYDARGAPGFGAQHDDVAAVGAASVFSLRGVPEGLQHPRFATGNPSSFFP